MPSPFPGMDPYLERHWRDVHLPLIAEARRALNHTLPADLVARSEERVFVELDDGRMRNVMPDVRVVEDRPGPARPEGSAAAAGATVAGPVFLALASDPIKERFLEIREADGGPVITAIEFVSPTNKLAGAGRDAYLQKRAEFMDSESNLVEIDLTRVGDWVRLMQPYVVLPEYRASIRRATRPERAELYPITLLQRLPVIPIPLRKTDADVYLDLQGLVDRAYEDGRYDRVDYARPPVPPLDPEDAAWADELLRAAGRR
jgi:hypothetical protein